MSFKKSPNFLGNLFGTEMTNDEQRLYRFDSYVLDAAERELIRDGVTIPLTPKAFDTLVFLVRNGGHLVTKNEMMEAVWPDSFVEEGNLTRTIYTLRKALGEDENGHKFIKTVPTKGYRFVANVEISPNPAFLGPSVAVDNSAAGLAVAETGLDPDPPYRELKVRAPKPWAILLTASGILLALLAAGAWFAVRRGGGIGTMPRQTSNGKAYQFFRQGKILVERHLDGDIDAALENFDKAIELDPNYADAYAGRADARIWRFWGTASHDDIGLARAAIDKALQLDRSSAYAHALLCRIKATYDWEFADAERECLRAIALDPRDDEARREHAYLLNSVGRQDEALAEIDVAVALAPTSFNKRSRGVLLYFSRRYDEAIDHLKQIEESDPEFRKDALYLMDSYEMKKDWANALECYIRLRELNATPQEIAAIRTSFAAGGWPAVLRINNENPIKNRLHLAGSQAQLGDADKAFEILNEMAAKRQVMIVHIATDPRLDPIRSDPRFAELLKRVGLR